MALLERVVETLGGGALLEDMGHWAWALKYFSLASLPVHSLLPDCGCNVNSLVQASAFMPFPMMDLNQNKPFPPSAASCKVLGYSEVTKSPQGRKEVRTNCPLDFTWKHVP